MTQGVDLRSLLERVQKAQGPDSDLDDFIEESFHGPKNTHCEACGTFSMRFGKPYTSSVDAVVALVSEFLPGWQWNVEGGGMRQHACLYAPPVSKDDAWIGQRGRIAETPALSLLECLIAALIAKAEVEEGVGEF